VALARRGAAAPGDERGPFAQLGDEGLHALAAPAELGCFGVGI
jgi:hypothetical protein